MFSRQIPETVVEEQTPIWSCTDENCKGWMRENFVFEEKPSCPLCGSGMTQDTKMLPALVNTTRSTAFQ